LVADATDHNGLGKPKMGATTMRKRQCSPLNTLNKSQGIPADSASAREGGASRRLTPPGIAATAARDGRDDKGPK
jgi:hypothetical protein